MSRLQAGLLLACLFAPACALPASCRGLLQRPPAGGSGAWTEHPGNPVIRMGQLLPGMVWNDPSVLREGDSYRMWLSGGDPRDRQRIVVQIHAARSADGVAWAIDPHPCLSPDPAPAWDSLRVETPSVVKVGDTYHLYYSGTDEQRAQQASYSIGHATSRDGVTWLKDPANPVITAVEDGHGWGAWGAVEPAAVVDPRDGTISVYYVGLRRLAGGRAQLGILLARSRDGSRFTHHVDAAGQRAVVFTRDVPDAAPGAWYGVSTPSVLLRPDGEAHLFCDVLIAPGGPTTARQVALVHAVSRDGTSFAVLEDGFFRIGQGDWKDDDVRAPVVLEREGRFEMWFAGQSRRPFYQTGIGFATRAAP
jgi:hypothetical protein